MTHPKTNSLRHAGVPAAGIAALLLAGCSATHVGDAWQCPLPKGGACGSVAEADPAVPDTRAGDPAAAGETVLREPLWRVRADRTPGPPPEAGRSCEAECGGFDPFAWLARLFADGGEDGETQPPEAAPGGTGTSPSGSADRAVGAAAGPSAAAGDAARTERPAAAALPAEPGPAQDGPAQEDPAAGELRTEEVVARIWIAPFVDADGVYREASHVRVVLEPAGWRVE